ncbi:MAG: EexN family lipoprotein [Steroidobacteraceae bacterium]
MTFSFKSIAACGCLVAVFAAATACGPKRIPPMTVDDLIGDRVTLDGVLMKCNQNPSKARTDVECQNARIAIDRLAGQNEAAVEAKRAEDFERSREQLRLAQDKQRQEQAAKSKPVDAYHLPLVPVEPPAPAAPGTPATPSGDASAPPVVSQSNP